VHAALGDPGTLAAAVCGDGTVIDCGAIQSPKHEFDGAVIGISRMIPERPTMDETRRNDPPALVVVHQQK
jgi:hypothetical protein